MQGDAIKDSDREARSLMQGQRAMVLYQRALNLQSELLNRYSGYASGEESLQRRIELNKGYKGVEDLLNEAEFLIDLSLGNYSPPVDPMVMVTKRKIKEYWQMKEKVKL